MNGVIMIQRERDRQIHGEGWTAAHDDTHSGGELLRAAIAYIEAAYGQALGRKPKADAPMGWPFDQSWWKPEDASRNLVKAGALIAAEIDRLRRLPRCVYRVSLEPGVWIATGYGDPPRTIDPANAATFSTRVEAETALFEARSYRPFREASIESSIAVTKE